MEDKSDELNELATNAIVVAGATRAMAESLAVTSAALAKVGADELEEGLTRTTLAGLAAERAEDLADMGADMVTKGISDFATAEGMDVTADELALGGVGQVAEGAAMLGEAKAMAATGEAFEEAAA